MEAVLTQHIVMTPGTCGGKPRIAGPRIRVLDVVIDHEPPGKPVSAIVEAFEISGLRTAAAEGAEFDAIYHETPSFGAFGRIAAEQGLETTLGWRDEPFGSGHGEAMSGSQATCDQSREEAGP